MPTLTNLFLDVLYPPSCCSCDAEIPSGSPFCSVCALSLYAIEYCCKQCGIPYEQESFAPCRRCLKEPPLMASLMAPFLFGGELANAIRHLKYRRRLDVARSLAPLFAPSLQQAAHDADVIIPIPLHKKRRVTRGFNQTALLLKAACRLLDTPPKTDKLSLRRVKNTIPQTQTQTRTMRNQNMNQAFAVHPHRTDYIKNNVILLIDDIATTGATMNAAAQALLNAGASAVHGLCLARSDG